MHKPRKKLLSHILNIITIALIVECSLCAMMAVRMYAKENCFDRMEETTSQVANMFTHAMEDRLDKLYVFADILAANSENPDMLLQTYMENFCKTQYFSALCIHRANGTTAHYGEHPHDMLAFDAFEAEVAKAPYISEVLSAGEQQAEDRFVYQAVPIVRNGKAVAMLYGYMSLDLLPKLISSTAYDGKCHFYIVDGATGDFLMDEYHGILCNLYDGSMGEREAKSGYDMNQMRIGVQSGQSGYFVFKSQQTGDWYYTYYMPLAINNWSMQLTIDEDSAFAAYNDVNRSVLLFVVAVVALMVVHVAVLMRQNAAANREDKVRLHKSDYVNEVQRQLLNAHSNPELIEQALKTVADEMTAETVLLLSLSGRKVTNALYWPSVDKASAMDLVGRNIREDFPMLFDLLSVKKSVMYSGKGSDLNLSLSAMQIFDNLDVNNVALAPITDTAGVLKGVLAAVNIADQSKNCEMLECVTYDFFMAIANIENHAIIKSMSEMDYLTRTKNRNSYEAEIGGYTTMECDSLWCVFIDVNGLHDINNTKGHKAGDRMLCAVADAIKRVFGNKHTYRLGGDEFVAFAMDSTHEEFLKKKKAITAELAAKGYYVSVGFEGIEKNLDGTFDVERVVSDAEAIMYHDKWEYYQANNIPSERGHFPSMMAKNE